ncbi:MAG: PEGA domain-containing protein [Myxococcota bacterium]|nr:PEGA domain-containing protein [Myxococcota bacterium]MDW8362117.1 PEGA domain-containing protein [Myxococcales bacterium]
MRLLVRTEPPGAVLHLDGTRIANPAELRLSRDGRPHRLTASAAGHETSVETVVLDRDRTVTLRLRPTRGVEPAPQRSSEQARRPAVREHPPTSPTSMGRAPGPRAVGFVTDNPY